MSPVTNDHQTGLLAQAQRIADEFTLGSEDVQRVAGHFVRQMSMIEIRLCDEKLLTNDQGMASPIIAHGNSRAS